MFNTIVMDFSDTTSSILKEFLGIISNAVVSSIYFVRMCQLMNSLFTMTVKSVNPSFVPCGMPPLTCFHDDREEPTRTACVRLVRKERI